MKTTIQSLFLYTLCIAFLSFRFADAYTEFGINAKEVEDKLLTMIQRKEVFIPYLSASVKTACRSISPEGQAAAVNKIGGLVKSYYASEDFKKRYNQWAASSFPQASATVNEKRRTEIVEGRNRDVQSYTVASLEPVFDMQIQAGQTFAGMENMLASLPADQKAEFRKQVDDGKKSAAFFKKLKPLLKTDFAEAKKQYASYLAEDQINQEETVMAKRNRDNAAEFEKWKNPQGLLAARLTDFLNRSNGVDFAAQTKIVNNKTKFVNPAYEGKDGVWKFCYRIGKTPSDAARVFARQWLAELK